MTLGDRSAGGTHERALRRARDARPRTARARAVRAIAAPDRLCQGARARLRADACRRRPGVDYVPRSAGQVAGRSQVRARRVAARSASVRRIGSSAMGRGEARLRVARRDLRARRRCPRLLAFRARALRRRLSCRRPRSQLLLVPLHAGGVDARDRRARARLHGVSRRYRADGTASGGDGRSAAGRLHRHAVVPAHNPRARRRARREVAEPDEGNAFRRTVSTVASRCADRARRSRLSGVRDGGRRRDCLRDDGARRARPRRRGAGRDRPAGNGRPRVAGRSGRGCRHAARQRRLPDDPFRHR